MEDTLAWASHQNLLLGFSKLSGVKLLPRNKRATAWLARFWRHDLQAQHPLAEFRVVEVDRAALKLCALFCSQGPELRESRFLWSSKRSIQHPVNKSNKFLFAAQIAHKQNSFQLDILLEKLEILLSSKKTEKNNEIKGQSAAICS